MTQNLEKKTKEKTTLRTVLSFVGIAYLLFIFSQATMGLVLAIKVHFMGFNDAPFAWIPIVLMGMSYCIHLAIILKCPAKYVWIPILTGIILVPLYFVSSLSIACNYGSCL